jgi:uncharacterized membrane protein (UPF0127 family)
VSAGLEKRFEGLPVAEYNDGLLVIQARTHGARRQGLSRLDSMDPDHALYTPQCQAAHTFGMRFSVDLIWLRMDGTTVRIDRDVAPWRMRFCVSARSVVQTVAGRADAFRAAGVGERPIEPVPRGQPGPG